jgi:cAMP-dependent protein kinase regulator
MKPKAPRSLAPTHALDFALAALARNRADECLRRAAPALADVGADAAAADIVARAAVSLGNMHLARVAFEVAARALALRGMAGHAVAAALSVKRLTGNGEILTELAGVLGADAERAVDTSVRPPPLRSEDVTPIGDEVPLAEVFARVLDAVEALRARLPAQLPPRSKHPLWGALPRGAFERFAEALEVRVCRPNEVVIREGEHGGSVFFVARGEVRVLRRAGDDDEPVLLLGDEGAPVSGDELAVLGAETVFGEMALLTAAPRAASAVTTRACVLLEAPRDAVNEASREVPAVGRELAAWGRRRLLDNLLRTAPLLRDVDVEGRTTLTSAFETRSYKAGDVVIAQGAESSGLHLIASGRVVVRREEAERTLAVAVLGPGDAVGEVSLVLRRPTNAAVVALEATVAMVLQPAHFMDVVRGNPALLASLYELAVARDEEMHSVVAQAPDDAEHLLIV